MKGSTKLLIVLLLLFFGMAGYTLYDGVVTEGKVTEVSNTNLAMDSKGEMARDGKVWLVKVEYTAGEKRYVKELKISSEEQPYRATQKITITYSRMNPEKIQHGYTGIRKFWDEAVNKYDEVMGK